MSYQRIVVKLGTSTLTAGTSNLSMPQLVDLVRQLAQLHSEGNQILLVSSGAIAAGSESLDFPELPKYIPAKQMLAAVGQPVLMGIYTKLFHLYGKKIAQVLLTRTDITDRHRYLNARNTLEALLAHQVVPVINENDTVVVEEIRVGDNDNLSALVANLIEADLLVLLTDQPGIFTSDPRRDANATLITKVTTTDIPEDLWRAAGGANTELGTGGMVTKLQAADLARRSGTKVVIAQGSDSDILLQIARNESIGTHFLPTISKLESKKRFMLAGIRTSSIINVDKGAEKALRKGGSLLPIGVLSVDGDFDRGDTVRISSHSGKEIALGLVNYDAKDLSCLRGQHSKDIERLLGYTYGDEIIHHNNMLLL